MRLSCNVKGAERKSLVAAISQELNAPTKYLGAPTFAYEVGGYHIDKNGTVTGSDNLDLEDALHQQGFDADGDSRHYDEPDTYESGLGGMGALDEFPDIDQHHPGRYANPNAPITDSMQKQIDEVIDFEDLRMDGREELGLGRTRRENFQGENGMQADDIPEPDELVIEMPLTGFTPEKLDNLAKLVNSKAPLLRAALGTDDLPIKQTTDRLQFPWFRGTIDAEHTEAYATLVSLLCKTAKEKSASRQRKRTQAATQNTPCGASFSPSASLATSIRRLERYCFQGLRVIQAGKAARKWRWQTVNNFISKAALEARRTRYKKGARVELVSMTDLYTKLKPGDMGTVDFADDTGTVFIIWDSGSHLGVVFGEDEIRLLPSAINDTIKEHILAVRATGETNMFDTNAVQRIAFDHGFYELVNFIETDRKAYGTFILTGGTGDVE